jgi:hypothetical protein
MSSIDLSILINLVVLAISVAVAVIGYHIDKENEKIGDPGDKKSK